MNYIAFILGSCNLHTDKRLKTEPAISCLQQPYKVINLINILRYHLVVCHVALGLLGCKLILHSAIGHRADIAQMIRRSHVYGLVIQQVRWTTGTMNHTC